MFPKVDIPTPAELAHILNPKKENNMEPSTSTFLEKKEWVGFRVALGDTDGKDGPDVGIRLDVFNPLTGKVVELISLTRNIPLEELLSMGLKSAAAIGLPIVSAAATWAIGNVRGFAEMRKLLPKF